MKKIIAAVLVVIMALSCIPMSLAADVDYVPANGETLTGTSEGKGSITIKEGVTVSVTSSYELKKSTSMTSTSLNAGSKTLFATVMQKPKKSQPTR